MGQVNTVMVKITQDSHRIQTTTGLIKLLGVALWAQQKENSILYVVKGVVHDGDRSPRTKPGSR